MIHLLAQVLLALAIIGCFTFVVSYQVLADWRSTAVGRNVMAFMAVVGILLTLALLRTFVPNVERYADWLRIASFSAVGAIVWHRVFLLYRAQSGYSDADHAHRPHGGTMAPEQRDDGRLAEVRDLTAEEYDATYATGSGGHELPPEVLAELDE